MVNTHERHPMQWTPLLPTFLEFCFSQIHNVEAHHENEKFLVHCMTFLKQAFVSEQYPEGTKVILSNAYHILTVPKAREIIENFGTQQNILQLVLLLIKKYVPLTLTHLEEWKDDPESFLTGEEMDLYTEKKRVCLLIGAISFFYMSVADKCLVYGRKLNSVFDRTS